MPPFVDYSIIINFFRIILQFLRVRRLRVLAEQEEEEDLQLLAAAQNSFSLFLSWLRLLMLFLRMRRKRRRLLIKPHLMLPFMPGFRINAIGMDVWASLEQNWVHFFWLTGETPQTLTILVNTLRNRNFVHLRLGRIPSIDFRNQVSGMEIKICHLSELYVTMNCDIAYSLHISDTDDNDISAALCNHAPFSNAFWCGCQFCT